MFRVLLTIIAAIIMALIIYTLTLDMIYAIALLKLIGAPNRVILGMILQQALLLGGLGCCRPALANHPSVLLADEPTAALDSHRGRQVMELFRDVARQHAAGVIVVTHDHRTLDVFDTICEMEDGVIRVSGPELSP